MNPRVCGFAAAACLAMTATACGGDGGEEAVFIYFINGYPGTGKMSVNSSRGTLVNNVPFGERYGEDNTSCAPGVADCLPVRVERQFGSEFKVRMENMAETADISKDLFSLYPHETATMVVTRRSGESGVDSHLLRHTQSISSDCMLTMINGLALDNGFTTDVGNYSITPEVFTEDIAYARFDENESSTPFISECGQLPTDDPTHAQLQRAGQIELVKANPWFLPADGDEDEFTKVLRWGIPGEGGRTRIGPGGSFLRLLDSREYIECIQAGISIRQPEDQMTPIFPGAEVDCPNDANTPLTWADVDIDFQAVQQCQYPVKSGITMLDPGQSDTSSSIVGANGDALICNMRFRVRNQGMDIVFGPKGNDDLGRHGDGAVIQTDLDIPSGAQHFYVMLGRPVNPIVWQWDSSDSFVDLGFYPYFNGPEENNANRPVVGEYD